MKHAPLQQRISLIQIACADKVGLFHIGLHPGKTSKGILAPSLRSIIESADIKKTGVGVLSEDFSRLQKYFDLTPRGAFELSHLYNLLAYRANATTGLRRLSTQVEEHLGLPLDKGKEGRSESKWNEPLDSKQIEYAASDAYAGFMLYHCLNAKRAAMEPVPPLPVSAEAYPPLQPGPDPIHPLRLATPEGYVLAVCFFRQAVAAEDQPHVADGQTVSLVQVENQQGTTSGPATATAQESPVDGGGCK